MRELKNFKNIHQDKDIYILASGKSVDFIDNSFFKNKIIIGINQSYKKIKCNYLVRKESALIKEVIKNNDKDVIHFISNKDCGGSSGSKSNIELLNNVDTTNIVIYNHDNNSGTDKLKQLPNENKLIVTYSTITTGIHLAAHMGAKNIILVGHDCGTINDNCNFTGYHTDKTYKIAHKAGINGYVNWLKQIENTTIELKILLKQNYNCNVCSLNPFINFNLEGNVYRK